MMEPGTGNVIAMTQNLEYGPGKNASYINNSVDLKYSGTNGQAARVDLQDLHDRRRHRAGPADGRPHRLAIVPRHARTAPTRTVRATRRTPGRSTNYSTAPSRHLRHVRRHRTVDQHLLRRARQAHRALQHLGRRVPRRRHGGRFGPRRPVAAGEAPVDNTDLQVTPGVIGGSFGMSPLTLAESYATFAARGLHCEPRVITDIRTLDKEQIDVPKPDCEQVIEPEVADAVNDVLVGRRRGRHGARQMYLDRPTAGKTGTTNDFQALWFAGLHAEHGGRRLDRAARSRRASTPWRTSRSTASY